jgi:hypothetical protein
MLSNQHKMWRELTKEHSRQALFQLVQWFQRRIRTPDNFQVQRVITPTFENDAYLHISFALLYSNLFLNIYIFIKIWKIYWSERSFTGLGPEDRCSSWGHFVIQYPFQYWEYNHAFNSKSGIKHITICKSVVENKLEAHLITGVCGPPEGRKGFRGPEAPEI